MKDRVNYDAVASTYNERFTGGQRPGTEVALVELVERLQPRRLLEVGCGTGHWLRTLARLGPACYGLDPSAGMLKQAQKGSGPGEIHRVRGRGEQIPFPAGSFDLVYCVNAIHHMEGQRDFVMEARRLLRPGGTFAVLGMAPHGRRDSWYIYHYFPQTYACDQRRFPTWERVEGWMQEAGLTYVQRRLVEEIDDPQEGREVFDAPFLKKNACSQLALLSDEEYAAGLERIEVAVDVAEETGETLTFRSHILIEMITGVLKE